MKDSKLLSDKYVYEFIFNMSEDEWLQQRTDIVEDLKLRFRQNQIEQEGNDPAITGISFGTPHDLATVHMSSNEVEEKDKGGRPPEGIKYGQHKNEFGWDPTGKKEIDQAFNVKNQTTAFLPGKPTAEKTPTAESRHNILNYLKGKTPKIILESLKSNKIVKSDSDRGSLLDEDNIL